MLAYRFILELRPQNAGCIKQLKLFIHREPLVAPCNAGTVFGFGAVVACNTVDK